MTFVSELRERKARGRWTAMYSEEAQPNPYDGARDVIPILRDLTRESSL